MFYRFSVDDNIRFLKEITENHYSSIFDHPYLSMYKRLHEEFDLEVQLNLFYRMPDFELSQMSDAYRCEWEENAHWLKLSFQLNGTYQPSTIIFWSFSIAVLIISLTIGHRYTVSSSSSQGVNMV